MATNFFFGFPVALFNKPTQPEHEITHQNLEQRGAGLSGISREYTMEYKVESQEELERVMLMGEGRRFL